MLNKKDIVKKLNEAVSLLYGSIGEQGLFAGSGPRYKHQYWTRDLTLALASAFESLKRMRGNVSGLSFVPESAEVVEKHYNNLIKRQSKNGAIPILFADFSDLLAAKISRCPWDGKNLNTSKSFVLTRMLSGMMETSGEFPEFDDFPDSKERGLYRLTPGTTDSELMFAFGILNDRGDCDAVKRAVAYLEQNYVHNGLHHGADWRDTKEKFFKNKPLLSNNSLLYAVYAMMGETEKAEALKLAIERTFWNGKTYLDYPKCTRFNPLSASLAILHGVVPSERYEAMMTGFRSVDSPFGLLMKCEHNPFHRGEATVINRTKGVVVYPFGMGSAILAIADIDREFALEQLYKYTNLRGFAEWYDPANGQRWGEYEQGWSAAMYICAVEKLKEYIF